MCPVLNQLLMRKCRNRWIGDIDILGKDDDRGVRLLRVRLIAGDTATPEGSKKCQVGRRESITVLAGSGRIGARRHRFRHVVYLAAAWRCLALWPVFAARIHAPSA